jgi:hypothetical protein
VAELATAELKGPLDRRKLENLIQNIGTRWPNGWNRSSRRGSRHCRATRSPQPFLAVEDTLGKVNLSDAALLADDAV